MCKYNKYTMNTIFITCFSKKNHTQLSIYHFQVHFPPDSYHLHSSPNKSVSMLCNPVWLTPFVLSVHPWSILVKRLFWNKNKSIPATSTSETLDESKESQEHCMHVDMAGTDWTQVHLHCPHDTTCTVFPEESVTQEWSRQTGHPNDHASGRARRFSSWRRFWFVHLSCFVVS